MLQMYSTGCTGSHVLHHFTSFFVDIKILFFLHCRSETGCCEFQKTIFYNEGMGASHFCIHRDQRRQIAKQSKRVEKAGPVVLPLKTTQLCPYWNSSFLLPLWVLPAGREGLVSHSCSASPLTARTCPCSPRYRFLALLRVSPTIPKLIAPQWKSLMLISSLDLSVSLTDCVRRWLPDGMCTGITWTQPKYTFSLRVGQRHLFIRQTWTERILLSFLVVMGDQFIKKHRYLEPLIQTYSIHTTERKDIELTHMYFKYCINH